MNAIKEFALFEGKEYAPTTRRVYLAAAKKALKVLGNPPNDCLCYEELLASLRENRQQNRLPRTLRITPFLSFLESKVAEPVHDFPDYEGIRTWVLVRIEEETKTYRKVSHLMRRDLAMLASVCIAPERGSPRRWPKNALVVNRRKGGGFEVRLWEKEVSASGLALALLYWHIWRERLGRPEQSRLYRKDCAYSDLLFPNSKGEALKKQVLNDALSRLSARRDAPAPLTPGLIRQAFLTIPN
jgi:hypothetical protein